VLRNYGAIRSSYGFLHRSTVSYGVVRYRTVSCGVVRFRTVLVRYRTVLGPFAGLSVVRCSCGVETVRGVRRAPPSSCFGASPF